MHRADNSKFLLYIEPKADEKLKKESTNEYIKIVEDALKDAKEGVSNYSDIENKKVRFDEGYGYKGFHTTDCGKTSSNKDYLLPNGMITNSLAPFYLRWYWESIPESEIEKLKELKNFLNSQK